jgi:tetratricopeptide (TPR) repeat protein
MRVSANPGWVFLHLLIALVCASTSCRTHSQPEASANPTQTAAQYLAQAQQFYAQRADLMRLREGIIGLRQARTVEPGNYDAAWQFAKFNYYLATHTDNSAERERAFREGIEAGKAAVALQDGKPDGHFWLGANYGAAAQSSVLAGLTTVGEIQKEMDTVLRLNEGYQDGSAYMVLGLVYLRAPALAGGDPQKAVEMMEKGLRFGQGNAILRLNLAEAYVKTGRTAQAREQANAILSMTPDQNYLPEYQEAAAGARKLMDQIH